MSRDGTALHLSEHHGDATPGSRVRIQVDDVEALHGEEKNYAFAKPRIEDQPWGMGEVTVADPFGNIVVFAQAIAG